MTTMRDFVTTTKRDAYGNLADQMNFLADPYPLGGGSLHLSLAIAGVTTITPGMVLSAGLNEWFVTAVDTTAQTVDVYASLNGSRNEALPAGTPVLIRPRVTDFFLFEKVNEVVRALSSPTYGLYREMYWEDPNTSSLWGVYEIPDEVDDMEGLLRVSVRQWGNEEEWRDIYSQYIDWQNEQGLVRMKGITVPSGQPIRFFYKARFRPAANLTDDAVDDMRIPEEMHDIPPLGAAARLFRSNEGRRNQPGTQGDSRRAEEVQSGVNSATGRDLYAEFQRRVGDEALRLVRRNPYRRAIL